MTLVVVCTAMSVCLKPEALLLDRQCGDRSFSPIVGGFSAEDGKEGKRKKCLFFHWLALVLGIGFVA